MRCPHCQSTATTEESIKNLGSSRQRLFLHLQIWIPALEHHSELLIQGSHPHVQQEVRAVLGPLHLLAFAEALAEALSQILLRGL